MLFVFFDDTRVAAVVDATFVADYGTTYVDVVPAHEGPLERTLFSHQCQMIRTSEATACTLFQGTDIDTGLLDDFLLLQYRPVEPAK